MPARFAAPTRNPCRRPRRLNGYGFSVRLVWEGGGVLKPATPSEFEVTLRVTAGDSAWRPGRIVVGADERSLTPYAGLAVSGELARRVGLAELIDAELAVERRARPVKVRRRGLSAGEL